MVDPKRSAPVRPNAPARKNADVPGAGSVLPADHPPIAFSDSDWSWFAARCSALRLPDPAAHRERLQALYGHLVGVNRWMNLTRLADAREYLKQHVLDALTLFSGQELKDLDPDLACADVGTGGGYPGLVLASFMPDQRWILIDSRVKKIDFVRAALPLTGNTSSKARCVRAGEAHAHAVDLLGDCQLVVARGVGQAAELLGECANLIPDGGHLVLLKGPSYVAEEHPAALNACQQYKYKHIRTRPVKLEDGDPPRFIVTFEMLGN